MNKSHGVPFDSDLLVSSVVVNFRDGAKGGAVLVHGRGGGVGLTGR